MKSFIWVIGMLITFGVFIGNEKHCSAPPPTHSQQAVMGIVMFAVWPVILGYEMSERGRDCK